MSSFISPSYHKGVRIYNQFFVMNTFQQPGESALTNTFYGQNRDNLELNKMIRQRIIAFFFVSILVNFSCLFQLDSSLLH